MRLPKRNHMSKNKNLKIYKFYKQKSTFKPNGLWYSYYNSWYKWLDKEQLQNRFYKYIHHIIINNNSLTNIDKKEANKILVINSIKDFDSFHKRYKIKINKYDCINWKLVSKDYGGIEIAPYLLERRKIDWYNTFDIASGCIWNNKIIKSTSIIYEKVDDNYIKV